MAKYAMFVDYEYCTGCHACEVACNQEHNRPLGQSGIKVFESIMSTGAKTYVNYLPVRTDLCNYCAARRKKGKLAACAQHCLSGCLQVGDVEEFAGSLKEQSPKKMLLI